MLFNYSTTYNTIIIIEGPAYVCVLIYSSSFNINYIALQIFEFVSIEY